MKPCSIELSTVYNLGPRSVEIHRIFVMLRAKRDIFAYKLGGGVCDPQLCHLSPGPTDLLSSRCINIEPFTQNTCLIFTRTTLSMDKRTRLEKNPKIYFIFYIMGQCPKWPLFVVTYDTML